MHLTWTFHHSKRCTPPPRSWKPNFRAIPGSLFPSNHTLNRATSPVHSASVTFPTLTICSEQLSSSPNWAAHSLLTFSYSSSSQQQRDAPTVQTRFLLHVNFLVAPNCFASKVTIYEHQRFCDLKPTASAAPHTPSLVGSALAQAQPPGSLDFPCPLSEHLVCWFLFILLGSASLPITLSERPALTTLPDLPHYIPLIKCCPQCLYHNLIILLVCHLFVACLSHQMSAPSE